MKILLIVGAANDIFITAMTKWLKKSIPEATIDIFEFYPTDKQEKNIYADNITAVNKNIWIKRIKGINTIFFPFYASHCLKNFLNNKFYDIIQCHWITPPLILTKGLHQHCKKLFATFWGREWANFKICNSNTLNRILIKSFINEIDYLLNSEAFKEIIDAVVPNASRKHICANLGAVALDSLCLLMEKESKTASKRKMHIDTEKATVLIGYSGKSLHQHLKIIDELNKAPKIKQKIHLLAPMTRGASEPYIKQVETALKKSGFAYTLLKDRFLSNEELASLRHATDVTLQLSSTDGFSRSIVECFCAKSIVIYGDWLNYKGHLTNASLVAHPVSSIQEGIKYLSQVVNNLPKYEEECLQNSINAKKGNLWSECIHNWVNAYRNALND